MAIDFIFDLDEPLDREALRDALLTGRHWLERRLRDQGDNWLSKDDDPFVSRVPNKCWIRVDSKKTPSGRACMTYKTLLHVYEGLNTAMISLRNNFEGTMRIQVADQLSGHGTFAVKDSRTSAITENR